MNLTANSSNVPARMIGMSHMSINLSGSVEREENHDNEKEEFDMDIFANFSRHFEESIEAPYKEYNWLICEIVLLLCAAVALYILFALIYFYYLQPKRLKMLGRRTGGRWLEKMCILAVVTAVLRMANNQALLFMGWNSPERCSVLLNVSIALYFLAMHPIYLFLWIRQRIFYSNRALKHLYGRGIRFLSWATIFCFFVVTGVSMVVFVVDRENSASGRVCINHRITLWEGFISKFQEDHNVTITSDIWRKISSGNLSHTMPIQFPHGDKFNMYQGFRVNTIAGLFAGCIQVSFLVLFLYPIMDNKLREVRNKNLRCHKSLMKLIRRAFVLSGVCIFTDVTIALAVGSLSTAFPEAVFAPLVVYDINLLINIVCIVSTFRRWRGMLLPCYFFHCYETGKGLLRGSSKAYFLPSRKSANALDDTNGIPKQYLNEVLDDNDNYPTKSNIGLPKVDVMLDSDDDLETSSSGKYSQKEDDIGRIRHNSERLQSSREDEERAVSCSKAFSRNKSTRKTVHGSGYTKDNNIIEQKAILETNTTFYAPFVTTSRMSLRSKSKNNVVTTKIVLKSEMWMSESNEGKV